MAHTNPARLLHTHLSCLASRRERKDPAKAVIEACFSLEARDDVSVRRALLQLDDLFVEVGNRLQSLGGVDYGMFTKYFPQLRTGFANVVLRSPASGALSFISDGALVSLELCAARLGENYQVEELPEEVLAELENKLKEVFDYVEAADIEPEIRELALDLTETLRRALAQYRIRGIEGLRIAVDEALGKLTGLYLRRDGDVPKETFEHLKSLVLTADKIIASALRYGPLLIEGVNRLLGPG